MQDFVLLDGGHETQFRKYLGSGFEGHPLWICRYLKENPDICRQVCQDFITNGAEIILTNTYQATVDGFHKHIGLSKQESLDLFKLSVEICKEAVELEKAKGLKRSVAICGFVGPYGAHLNNGCEYKGGLYVDSMSLEELAEWHRPKIETLLEAGVDLLMLATIPSLKEAEALIFLLKQYPQAKAIISFSAQSEDTVSHGERFCDAAQKCWELAADQLLAVGVNCLHPRFVAPLVQSVQKLNPDIPLYVKCNSNEVFNFQTKEWELAQSNKTLPEYCREWLELGVKYVGGCCRTTVQDIADFRLQIDNFIAKAV